MAFVGRFKVDLSGFSGGPGVNTWFFADAGLSAGPSQGTVDGTAAALDAFYLEVAYLLQNDVVWTVDTSVAVLDDASGQIQSVVTAGGGPYTGAGTNADNGPHFTMVKCQLRTGVFEDGREIRGGPFLGPVSGLVAGAGGELSGSDRAALQTALENLAGAINTAGGLLVVYRRPRAATGGLPARDGTIKAVTAVDVWSKPASLRSRRD